MTWTHVKGLRAAGMGIGSHTHKHRVLQSLPPAELAVDLAASRAALEQEIGEAPRTIAYPVGKSVAAAPQVREAVARAGFTLGFTTTAGINRLGSGQDLLDLRRLTVDRALPTGLARTWMTFPFLAERATTGWSLG
jgi:peptidoglycan/xylan/chitin deacetylase (PgdA/CDA1 family)